MALGAEQFAYLSTWLGAPEAMEGRVDVSSSILPMPGVILAVAVAVTMTLITGMY